MAKYQVNGQDYDFPDSMPQEQAMGIISQNSQSMSPEASPPSSMGGIAPPTTVYPQLPPNKKVDPDTLQNDPDFLRASLVTYNSNNAQKWTGSNKDLAEYGLDQMGWFNYNLVHMGLDANRLRNATPDEKQSFLHLMDTYDRLEMSWSGAGRFIKGVAADPTTYAGLGSLGFGLFAKKGAEVASKSAIQAMLRTGVIAGIDTAVQGGAADIMKQSVEQSGGRRDAIDYTQAAEEAGKSGLLGLALGAAGEGVLGKLLPKKAEIPKTPAGSPEAQGAIRSIIDEDLGRAKVEPEGIRTPTGEAPRSPLEGPMEAAGSKVEGELGSSSLKEPTPVSEAPKPSYQPPTIEQIEARTKDGMPAYNAQDVIGAIKAIAPDMERGAAGSVKDILTNSKGVSEMLRNLDLRDANSTIQTLQDLALSRDQVSILTGAVKDARESVANVLSELTKAESVAKDLTEIAALRDRINDTNYLLSNLEKLDVPLSSSSGKDLASRKEGVFTGVNRGLSRESILAERGIVNPTEVDIRNADRVFAERVDAIKANAENTKAVQALDEKRATHMKNGEWDSYHATSAEKDAIVANMMKAQAEEAGKSNSKFTEYASSIARKTTEFVIGTVFTPATLVMNTVPSIVKTLYKPALKFIIDGVTDPVAYREMVSTYSGIIAAQTGAINAAKLAFKYERSMLTGDVDKMLDHAPSIEGMKGRIIRFFPRIMTATDEYFAQINYRGIVQGRATADAMQAGIEKGLKGDELTKFVSGAVEDTVKKAYDPEVKGVEIADFLRQKGASLGYSGENLTTWVKSEYAKNADYFKTATDQYGRDFANDLLFKRQFSGDSFLSRQMKDIEGQLQRHPELKLLGQLFLRTPVRVFEEGMRLTPGLNLIAPKFIEDLRGLNGPLKQVKAQGEAMMSYAFGATVLALYAQGKITGAGPDDFRQRAGLQAGKSFEPYSIKFEDGSTFTFRNLDPFSTPFKIVANALDRYQTLHYRVSQGEYLDKEMKEAEAWFGVGVGSIIKAVRDANLTQGMDDMFSFFESMSDPEMNDKKLTKFVASKLQWAVPNVVTKAAQMAHPIMDDPYTLEQYLRSRINPADPLVPKRYNSIGEVETISNPSSLMTGLNYMSAKDRESAIDPKSRAVLDKLSLIERATNSNFMAPYKNPKMGDFDLRGIKTKDGSESLYDRWQRYTAETGLRDNLHSALAGSGDIGTPQGKSAMYTVASTIINSSRNAAFMRMLSEESGVEQKYIQRIQEKAIGMAGERERTSVPQR
ncbi:hypothetical protein UFOVP63_32 [uncultured Caudovirales phage]|uniref:Large polyvalent protein associated domain-containing protein n=1 Tax=uncultured Caudovirales phage TaxID=2100421 RepID=A0A6J5KV53_9CAUD|nr:hypothetical protein UFOVP63_32 [uncultured Caudovirales phage]